MKILYFAWVKQKTGRAEETLDMPESVTNVSTLIDFLRQRGSGYQEAFRNPALIRVAVNQQHTDFNAILHPGDEVAFFPPVTGG
ncbi:MAG TPA: molybdopterin converting factor subunit 1 [Micropepsaceae bacterium]|nr:molybdopterin converting factor subunit 1 [Micropepsaceae bacterium]